MGQIEKHRELLEEISEMRDERGLRIQDILRVCLDLSEEYQEVAGDENSVGAAVNSIKRSIEHLDNADKSM